MGHDGACPCARVCPRARAEEKPLTPSQAAEWLPDLLAASFFVPCSQHAGAVVNLFSLTGRRAACPACCVKQNADNLLQVRPRARNQPSQR